MVGGAVGERNDPYMSFNFLVEIEGLVVGGFSEVSGLQGEIEVKDYREGGVNTYIHKFAGPARYPANLILKHGLTDSDVLWGWYQDVVQGKIERKNGTIFLIDQQQEQVMWWNFREAYPVKWIGPEFKAAGNAVAVETLEFVHHGLNKES